MSTIWIYKDIEKRPKLKDGNYLLGGIILEDGLGLCVTSDWNQWSVGSISEYLRFMFLRGLVKEIKLGDGGILTRKS